jgi:hypothetical protein
VAVDGSLLPDNARVAVETGLPVGIAEDENRIRAGCRALRRQDEAPHSRFEAQEAEEIARHVARPHLLALAVHGQAIHSEHPDRGHIGKHIAGLLLHVHGIRIGKDRGRSTALSSGRQEDNAFRVFHGQRSKDQAVHHAEDHGVGADAEGEGKNRDRGESGAAAQLAQAIAHILRQGFEPMKSPSRADVFFDPQRVAQRPVGGASCLAGGETGGLLFFGF